ncbi:MAG: DinB family protein [Parafilimonas sp.]
MNTHLIITKPSADEYPEWFAGEIELVHYNDLIRGLLDSFNITLLFLHKLSIDDISYRYAPGKWSIKQMWQHIIDVERILGYRALRYARRDETVLSGFDENKYADVSNADSRNFNSILHEYETVRNATIELFKSFTKEMFLFRGTTGRSNMTVRSVGYLVLGHEIHHANTIKERYLNREYKTQ